MKKPSALLLIVISLFISSSLFAQTQGISKNLPKSGLSVPKSGTPVTVDKIEADVAEALSVIESNHVVGKKINYNDVFKSSIDDHQRWDCSRSEWLISTINNADFLSFTAVCSEHYSA